MMHGVSPLAVRANPSGEELNALPARAKRAWEMVATVDHLGGPVYRIHPSPDTAYLVNLADSTCECEDNVHRGAHCKHLRRVAIAVSRGEAPRPDSPRIEEHVEPAHVGGDVFFRCTGCGLETTSTDLRRVGCWECREAGVEATPDFDALELDTTAEDDEQPAETAQTTPSDSEPMPIDDTPEHEQPRDDDNKTACPLCGEAVNRVRLPFHIAQDCLTASESRQDDQQPRIVTDGGVVQTTDEEEWFEAIVDRVGEDSALSPAEKETSINFAKGVESFDIFTREAGLIRRLISHPSAESITAHVLEDGATDRRPVEELDAEADAPIVAVQASLPIGALGISSSPRSHNQHASVVSDKVFDIGPATWVDAE